ncbi:hypothetical protein ACNOYE_13560 [Nannocystaceae bacterium ST9]
MRKTWMMWLGCGVLALVQVACKPSSEPTNTAEGTVRCPGEVAEPTPSEGEAGEGEGESSVTEIAEGSLGTGSQELCEQLANTYTLIVDAHASCETDADCGSYPEIGLCGATVNTKVPREQLAEIHQLRIGYACPIPMAKCMPPADKAVCQANVCERG